MTVNWMAEYMRRVYFWKTSFLDCVTDKLVSSMTDIGRWEMVGKNELGFGSAEFQTSMTQ